MYEDDLNILRDNFCEQSINSLQLIFRKANQGILSNRKKKKLQKELLANIRHEQSAGSIFFMWKVSPSGANHIIVTNEKCILINIYGVKFLFSNFLFLDGELTLYNIQWIETDNIVVFDVHYIVHNQKQNCICHFSNNKDSFTFFTAIEEYPPDYFIGN